MESRLSFYTEDFIGSKDKVARILIPLYMGTMAIERWIPLYSAKIANQSIEFSGVLDRVLNSHWYILGEEVANFEREFSVFVGVDHCVGVANGTEALELALQGLGVHSSDVVLTVANAGFYGSTALRRY